MFTHRLSESRTLDAGRCVQVFLDTQAAALGKAVSPTLRAKLALRQTAGYPNLVVPNGARSDG